jgi:RNA polymerase sigma-70 factor (ECF subfamily)
MPAPTPDRVALQAALATLPERHRQAIILHYLADVSIAEIAAITGAAEGTVKSWLHRGRAALAQRLGDHFVPTEVTGDA